MALRPDLCISSVVNLQKHHQSSSSLACKILHVKACLKWLYLPWKLTCYVCSRNCFLLVLSENNKRQLQCCSRSELSCKTMVFIWGSPRLGNYSIENWQLWMLALSLFEVKVTFFYLSYPFLYSTNLPGSNTVLHTFLLYRHEQE